MPVQNIDYRVISIGTLPSHPLWNDPADARTGHSTTTLICAGEARVLVDPGLPAQALVARLSERTNVKPHEITHVFLTALMQDHYRALPVFDHAPWLVFEAEREAALHGLNDQLERAKEGSDADLASTVRQYIELVERCRPAEDRLTEGVDLFPLPGVTPGTCGLLLPLPRRTVLVCGDAVATVEHLQEGKVLPHSADIEQAQESFKEAVEIADILIPGRDNIVMNPLRMVT